MAMLKPGLLWSRTDIGTIMPLAAICTKIGFIKDVIAIAADAVIIKTADIANALIVARSGTTVGKTVGVTRADLVRCL